MKATLYLKHRQALGEHTNLNAKVELHARTALEGGKLSEVEKRVDGRVELSQKLLNLTGPSPVSCFTSTLLTRPRLPAADSQDCRLRLGVDLRAQSVYAEARAIVFMSALLALTEALVHFALTLQARENHLSLKFARDRAGVFSYSVLYDL